MVRFLQAQWPAMVLLSAMIAFTSYRTYQCGVTGSCGILLPSVASVESTAVTEQLVPQWSLADAGGEVHRSSQYQGKVSLVNFWKTNCVACQMEIPLLRTLQAHYQGQPVQVIAMALLANAEEVKALNQKSSPNFPVLLANGETVGQFGEISMVPVSFLLDAEGKIVRRYEGMLPEAVVKKHIAELL